MYTLKTCVKKEDIDSNYIIAGISGGPDSMALLHYLKKVMPKKLVCAHVNHNVRIESDYEEEKLRKYCAKHHIIFESTKIENYTESNFENEARKKRYAFFEEMLKKYNSKYLFLAHHGDDLIETVIMKILRGSNIEGYAGMKQISKRKNYYIIRPFLNYTKENLMVYCQNYCLHYSIDSTNTNKRYTRNRIRRFILPVLKKENPNAHHQFLKYSKQLLEYYDYIDRVTTNIANNIYQNNTIKTKDLLKEDPFIQKNVIYKILTIIYDNKDNTIKESHLNNIMKILNSKKPNLIVNLPNNIMAIKEYDRIIFKKYIAKRKSYKIELEKYNMIDNHIISKIDNTTENDNNIIRLNSSEIKLPLYIRNRQDGDFISLKGTNGTKKIGDVFIDGHIPLSKRVSYPLLVDSNNTILWVPNLKKSTFDVPINEKYDIILKYCEKEDFNEQENS